LAPVALVHPHEHPWRIDVGDLQRCALGQAQPTGVDHLQTHPGFRVLDQAQEGPDLPQAQHNRQCLEVPGAHEVEDGPRALQRALIEEPDPIEVNPEGALGDCLLIEQEQEVLAELPLAELVGRAPIVLG
jgi:hypothetical protein